MSPRTYARPPNCSTATTTWVTSCRRKYDCTEVPTPTSVCAEGLVCLMDAEGRHLCNFALNWPPVDGGQYVTFVLAGLLVALFGAVAVFWALDRRRRSRRARHRRAAAADAKDGGARTPLLRDAPPPPPTGQDDGAVAPASSSLEMRRFGSGVH